MTPWLSGTVKISGGHLAYHRTGGSGPSLVLSHGLTDNGLCWSRVASALAPEFDVIMLDARGHGQSSRISLDAPHDPSQDIADTIEQLGLRSPIVMGHSVGARATAGYANTYPGRVSKVILEDPPFLPLIEPAAVAIRREKFRAQVETFQAMSEAEIMAMGRTASPLWHPGEFPAWATAKKQVDPNAMPHYATAWQDSIDRISVPTLLICGEGQSGGIVTPGIASEAERINTNVRSVEIAGAGHNVRRENFTDYMVAVRSFLGPT